MNAMKTPIPTLLAALLLSACVLGPEARSPDIDLPQTWPESTLLSEHQRAAQIDWWRLYQDPVLDDLVARATADNLSIREQVARVREARAQLGLASAERLPTLSGQAEASRRRDPEFPGTVTGGGTGSGAIYNLFSIAAVLDYEIDLWGRLARGQEAADALLASSIFSHDAVRLGIITDVVTAYFDLGAAQRELHIVERTLEARKESYALEQIRYDGGEADALTLRQAESALEGTRAQLPAQQLRLRRSQSALAILVGASPAELMRGLDFGERDIADIRLPDMLPATLPSELLNRRPDLRAAEAQLHAASAGIGIAQEQRLPRLNLMGLLGASALRDSDLFSSGAETWQLGASVALPVIDFGRGRARVEAAEAQLEQANAARDEAEAVLGQDVVTEIVAAPTFWAAEEYHQDFYRKNPLRYSFYRNACGRDQRVREVWGDQALSGIGGS